jgi:hypothetical protein
MFRVDCGACGLSPYGSLDDGERAADAGHPANCRPTATIEDAARDAEGGARATGSLGLGLPPDELAELRQFVGATRPVIPVVVGETSLSLDLGAFAVGRTGPDVERVREAIVRIVPVIGRPQTTNGTLVTVLLTAGHSGQVAFADLRRRLDEHGIEVRQVEAEAGRNGGGA